VLGLIDEAVASGARLKAAAEVIGLSGRTVIRWREQQGKEDRRNGPHRPPSHRLDSAERKQVVNIANSEEFRDCSPKQIVPKLADRGQYVASESSFYRILREEKMLAHRQSSKPATGKRPKEHVAAGPNQVWSWDITYLKSTVTGMFFYLYMIVDVWSRKIVAARVFNCESAEHSSRLLVEACIRQGIDPKDLVLHADNGGPMKGSTMTATMQKLGVIPSFSRPRVSDDNPYSEALFRTLKYRPEYPSKPFDTIEAAQRWVDDFVIWYNTVHLHSAIQFVTPDDRHYGREKDILKNRRRIYEQARRKHPARWSGATRNWQPAAEVRLNPETGSGNRQNENLQAA
jgi:transposase InsO family protein